MRYSPTVRGRRLMRELTRLRQDQELTLEATVQRLGWSTSKLYRIENGRTRISTDDLEDLLELYGVCSPRREALFQLGRDARKRGWWTAYADAFTGSYISMEAEAASIRIHSHIVPGLFQIASYAREVIASTGLKLDPGEAERKVAARVVRQQELFAYEGPPQVHVILGESALRCRVGGLGTTRQQLAALVAAAERPNVTFQVLPFSAGANAGMDGKFTILTFPDPEDLPVAYVEGLMGDVYLESEEEVALYNLAWSHLARQALSPDESTAMIDRLSKEELHAALT
jgi:transcriptional regulator with XRE-family HTH domain